MKNDRRTMQKLIAVAIQRRFSFLFSSFFFFSLLSSQFKTSGPQDLFLNLPSRLFIAKQGIWDEGISLRRAGYFTMKLFWWPRRARGQPRRVRGLKKCENDPFALPFEYFPHSFPKCQKTLRIAQQLALSSSIRLARIKMLANEGPWTKLGYESCPSLLIFCWK